MNQLKNRVVVLCLLGVVQLACLPESHFDKPYQPPAIQKVPLAKAYTSPMESDPYEFVPNNKRDPYLPFGFRRTVPGTTKEPKQPFVKSPSREPLTPLQRYEIDAYSLRAVISGVARPYAVVVDPTGSAHIVRPGMALGRTGRVTRILAKGLVISTSVRTRTNARQVRRVLLRFGKQGKAHHSSGHMKVGGRQYKLDERGQIMRK